MVHSNDAGSQQQLSDTIDNACQLMPPWVCVCVCVCVQLISSFLSCENPLVKETLLIILILTFTEIVAVHYAEV